MRLRFILPAALFLLLGGGLVYALMAIQSGKKDPAAVPSALVGKPAPEFSLPPPAGFALGFSTADLKGKVTLVNILASWCAPCRAEHPLLMELAKDKTIQLFGINYKDTDAQLADWLKDAGNPFARIGADRNGRVGIEWGVYGVPETYVLDRDARIVHRHVGPLTEAVLKDEIRPLLAKLKR